MVSPLLSIKENRLVKKAFLLCFALLLLGFAMFAPPTLSAVIDRCTVNSDCDATCGPGLGRCVQANPCCRVCLCTFGGT